MVEFAAGATVQRLMRMWYAAYQLNFRKPLGLAKMKERFGALLKIETVDGFGYADLHPWTELGDEDLQTQLRRIAEAEPTALARCSLEFAKADARMRAAGKNAVDGITRINNHYLVNSNLDGRHGAAVLLAAVNEAAALGFQTLKLKVAVDVERELSSLNEAASELSNFALRLDANARFTSTTCREFVARLDSRLREKIEFIEDPVPWSESPWRDLQSAIGIDLAVDRAQPFQDEIGYRVRIVKPAVDSRVSFWPRQQQPAPWRVVFTSYLDHPLGQAAAAHTTLQWAKAALPEERWDSMVCGLASHLVYEPNRYSECLAVRDARLCFSDGVGFGFTDLLDREDWRELK